MSYGRFCCWFRRWWCHLLLRLPLRLFRLPAYSPQLNPDEWVWQNVKHDGVAPAVPKGPEQMRSIITGRLRRLQRLPHIVRSFFADPELAYITAA